MAEANGLALTLNALDAAGSVPREEFALHEIPIVAERRLDELPHDLIRRIFAHVPIETKLRCSEVCRKWRDALKLDSSTWQTLSFYKLSGLHYTNLALLHAALKRASGALLVLDLSGWAGLELSVLLQIVKSHSRTLEELHLSSHEKPRIAGHFGSLQRALNVSDVHALLAAAPRLRLLDCDVACAYDRVDELLILQANPLVHLRVAMLYCSGGLVVSAERLQGEIETLARGAYLKGFLFDNLQTGCPFFEWLVDLMISCHLTTLCLHDCGLMYWPPCLPALTRLLQAGWLKTLCVDLNPMSGIGSEVIYSGTDLDNLCDALDASTLTSLCLSPVQRDVAVELLSSLTNHPHSLRSLRIGGFQSTMNGMGWSWPEQHSGEAAELGRAVAGLITCNSLLECLELEAVLHSSVHAMQLVCAAVASSTRLCSLRCYLRPSRENHPEDVLTSSSSLTEVIKASIVENTTLREVQLVSDLLPKDTITGLEELLLRSRCSDGTRRVKKQMSRQMTVLHMLWRPVSAAAAILSTLLLRR